MAVLLECKNINKEYGDNLILKDINLCIDDKERIGIVGSNGAGKTTLINIICGVTESSSGKVIFHKDNLKIGYMKQSIDYKNIDENNTLSGGEKTKKALNEVLYGKNDVLIFDEPTNHLDYEGSMYLINKIKKFKGAVIIISHDRHFLDQCVTKIIEIDDKSVQEYNGNYSFYRKVKIDEYENMLHLYNEQEKTKTQINKQIEQTKNWSGKAHRESRAKAIETGNKFGGKEFNRAKAKRMDKQIKSRIKRLEKIDTDGIKKPKEESKVFFYIDNTVKKGNTALYVKEISKSYGCKVIFEKSSFYIKQGEKVGLFGKNGCGKTTLIKAILGNIDFDGEVYLSKSSKVGYLSQDVIDLDDDISIIDLFDIKNNKEMGEIRTKLDLLGFHNESVYKKVACLSLGERMKVKLLIMMKEQCDILIMDEPTNHIDLHVREQLEEILMEFEGTLILVTHDRYMMEKTCDKLLVFDNNKITRYEYGLTEYLNLKSHSMSKVNEEKNNREKKEAQQRKLLIDNRITCVLSELSQCISESEKYKKLEEEYKKLIEERKCILNFNNN